MTSQALLDAPRKYSELRGEGSQHLIGFVPLACNTGMSLGIFAFPERAGALLYVVMDGASLQLTTAWTLTNVMA